MGDNGGNKETLFYGRIFVESHVVKKNRRPIYRNPRTGKSFIGKSQQLHKAEANMLLQLQSLKNHQKIYEPIRSNMSIMLKFFFKDFFTQKGIRSKHLPDLSNAFELPLDCLQAAGIIYDDNLVCSLDGSRRLPSNENVLEITIFEFKEPLNEKNLYLPGVT